MHGILTGTSWLTHQAFHDASMSKTKTMRTKSDADKIVGMVSTVLSDSNCEKKLRAPLEF